MCFCAIKFQASMSGVSCASKERLCLLLPGPWVPQDPFFPLSVHSSFPLDAGGAAVPSPAPRSSAAARAAGDPGRHPGTQTPHCRSSDSEVPPSDCFKMCIPRREALKSPGQMNHLLIAPLEKFTGPSATGASLDSEKTSFLQMQGCSELTNWHNLELFLKVCWALKKSSSFRNISKIMYEFIAFLCLTVLS